MSSLWNSRKDVSEQTKNPRDLLTQSVISIAFGLSAFLTFCALRPKWKVLYAARKRQKDAASKLPELPDTFFGWIPALYKITEEQVLASAGLDAFVFLAFFKMAIKFLAVVFFFSLTVIFPIHRHFDIPGDPPKKGNDTAQGTPSIYNRDSDDFVDLRAPKTPKPPSLPPTTDFLWVYVIFVYLFSGYLIYLIITETTRIIRIRQRFLGAQTSVTDRTIRLSGIPAHLRSEQAIKEIIESLEIGKVDSVMLCKNWKELDDLMAERMSILRMLEEAWTVHLGHRRVERNLESLPIVQPSPPEPEDDPEGDSEESALLYGDAREQPHVAPYARDRPMTRLWFGFLKLQSRRVDAIDYYQEEMRKIDDKIRAIRKKDFEPTPLAFVTLDSIPACQMAVQAIIDPEPMQLVANLAPAPADVVWKNTYLPRSNRMIRAWSITLLILLLTVFWSVLLLPLAALLDIETIRRVLPGFAGFLDKHITVASLVRTGLPTLLLSLLNVLVPYLYDWLSNLQGMTSQGDVEMSLISKNFFFTFFNLFIVFTIFGTASKASSYWEQLGDTLKDTTRIAYVLAESLGNLASFYMNLIVLQGLGLFPFRLLEFGSVAMYPINLMGAKTPRDYAELVQPPVFSYGFYLPQTLLIFIICIVYSVLPKSELVTLFGLIYFIIGSFIYKYQLLYAMDHRRHSTGRAWTIICNRVVVGLLVFQLAMTGQLAGRSAVKRAILVVPLLVGTVWFAYFYRRTYEPLMKFIALRSLHHDDQPHGEPLGESRYDSETDRGRAVDEDRGTGMRFINPSLIIPLEDVWIMNKRMSGSNHAVNGGSETWTSLTATTSSQILLSRGVAGSDLEPPSPTFSAAAPLVSIFENNSIHIMTLGSPARSIGIRYARLTNPSSTYPSVILPIDIPSERPLADNPAPVHRLDPTAFQGSSTHHIRWTSAVGGLRLDTTSGMTLDTNAMGSSLTSPATSHSSPDGSPSGGESPVRGRTLVRFGSRYRLVSRATCGRRAGPSSIDFETSTLYSRLTSRDLTAEPLELHDTVIEPVPLERVCSNLSELLTRADTFDSAVDLPGFLGHRDTFALFDIRHTSRHAPYLPFPVFHRLALFLDFETYRSLRLSCRCWSATISCVRPPKLPSVYFLPAEILHQIYGYLAPMDFNAARRSCRAWMMASLKWRLLETMLRRGGWWGAMEADMAVCGRERSVEVKVNEEWVMSKRLATECSLGSKWTGSGIRNTLSSRTSTSVVLTSTTDFSELGDGYSTTGDQQGSALHFTTSVCGKLVLIADGCVIYVYSLSGNDSLTATHGGHLEPMTSIICPRRVLAVSMDTSSQRFAVAALLDDRMGIVCELNAGHYSRRLSGFQQGDEWWGTSGYSATVASSPTSGERAVTEQAPPYHHDPARMPSWSTVASEDEDVANAASTLVSSPLQPDSPTEDGSRCISIEFGPRSIYCSLCSESDPPLSVAICPQRRCVAFGCSGGIELHWVDALTGQDLNRWFPLTAPSDFLYFLPPRKGLDSAKKLRLISSASAPGQRGGLMTRFAPFEGENSMGFEGRNEGTERTREGSDHYRAIPLSDGMHILFTDPGSGRLCVGSDAPLGGPTKLTRSIVLLGPDSEEAVVPSVYAVGQELKWGIRVAVGFADRIWLFCVPPDVFAGRDGDEQLWQDTYKTTNTFHDSSQELWPLHLMGTEIGQVDGLLDLAVDTSLGSLTIWAFAASGMVYTWQIDNGSGRRARKRAVLRDGAVVDLEDADGDFIMWDAPPLVPNHTRSQLRGRNVGFDGASSTLSLSRDPTSTSMPFPPPIKERYVEPVNNVDSDGDIEMADEDEGYASSDERPRLDDSALLFVQPLHMWGSSNDGLTVDLTEGYAGEGGLERAIWDAVEMATVEFEVV